MAGWLAVLGQRIWRILTSQAQKIITNTQTSFWFERRSEWRQSNFTNSTLHKASSSNLNSDWKRFYVLFFWNFAKVCIQAFRTESFLVLIYYIFSRNLRYLFHKIQIFSGSVNTNMARLPREALQALVCDSATEALTLLSWQQGFNADIFIFCQILCSGWKSLRSSSLILAI